MESGSKKNQLLYGCILNKDAASCSIKSIGAALAKALAIVAQEEERNLTFHAADAGAMPRKVSYLVIGKGFGDPRQRT